MDRRLTPHALMACAMAAGGLCAALLPSVRAAAQNSQPATQSATQHAWVTRAQVQAIRLTGTVDPPPQNLDPYSPMVFADLLNGVHFDKKTYTPDEEIRATLVVHSTTDALTRTVKAGVDFGPPGGKVTVDGSARLQLVRISGAGGVGGAKEEIVGEAKPAATGAARLTEKSVIIKPNDYWVILGDVRNLAAAPLAPGDYKLHFWVEGLKAEGDFHVDAAAATDQPAPPATRPVLAAKPPDGMVFSFSGGWQNMNAAGVANGGNAWKMQSPYPSPRNWTDFEAALPLGVGDGPDERYFPRISALPQADDVVGIKAEVIGKGLKEIKVTLTPQTTGKQIPRFPSLYLAVESTGGNVRLHGYNERDYVQTGSFVAFNKPITIDITMQDHVGPEQFMQGKVKLSVILASDPAWYGPVENGNGDDQMTIGAPKARTAAAAAMRWTGMVRSEPMDVTLTNDE